MSKQSEAILEENLIKQLSTTLGYEKVLIKDEEELKANLKRQLEKHNKDKQIGALKKGIKEYLKGKNLKLRYDIFHHCSASSANLQIVDYVSWAIFRKFEHQDDSYYKKIEKYLIGLDEMTKNRVDVHYER